MSHLPKLYEPFTVTGTFNALTEDESDAEIWLQAGGGVYLEGEIQWHGPMELGESKTISATFAFVTEGNVNVFASASNTKYRGIEQSTPVRMNVTRASSSWGMVSENQRGWTIKPGAPHLVVAGHNILVDTNLLVNTSPNRRIEIIQSREDVVRLQNEGLFPEELRYRWRVLDIKWQVDFSKQFLIVYIDEMRPTPGYVTFFEGGMPDSSGSNRLLWEDGVLKGRCTTYSLPSDVSRPDRATSSVTIRTVARNDKPNGIDLFAYHGPRTFEFSFDEGPSIVKQADLKTPTPATVLPSPTPQPIPTIAP